MRKITMVIYEIYKWDNNKGWVYYRSTPIREQAEHMINCLEKKKVKAKAVLKYL